MLEYDVIKITMDTYRYHLFETIFESYGIQAENKQNPNGQLRLIRKIASVCGIIAPDIERLLAEGMINFGPSAIMRFMAFLAAMFSKELIKEKVIYV